MTDQERAVMQQALEALERGMFHRELIPLREKAITALRAALAQQQPEPVQEPVAWIQPDHLQKARVAPFFCRVEPTQRCADFVPLYTTPPQRPPLTDEEIDRLWRDPQQGYWDYRKFARAIERAVRGE